MEADELIKLIKSRKDIYKISTEMECCECPCYNSVDCGPGLSCGNNIQKWYKKILVREGIKQWKKL